MWVDCDHCDGTGYNAVEGSCFVCGTRGVVFKKCCGCRDCKEQVYENGKCSIQDCPKDHDVLPHGNKNRIE